MRMVSCLEGMEDTVLLMLREVGEVWLNLIRQTLHQGKWRTSIIIWKILHARARKKLLTILVPLKI